MPKWFLLTSNILRRAASSCRVARVYIKHLYLTSEVEERCVVLERCKGEREVGLSCVGVLQGVPESGAGAKQGAANFIPVTLGVLEGGYGRAGVGSN